MCAECGIAAGWRCCAQWGPHVCEGILHTQRCRGAATSGSCSRHLCQRRHRCLFSAAAGDSAHVVDNVKARTATRPCYHRCCVSAAGLPHSSRPASAAAVLPQQLLCCSQGHPQTVWCVRWAVMCVVVPVCVSSRSATAAVLQSRVLTDCVVVWGGK